MTFPVLSVMLVPLRKKGKELLMIEDTLKSGFRHEVDSCKCTACKVIMRAVLGLWDETEVRNHILDGFILHVTICYWHRYQAHQDG